MYHIVFLIDSLGVGGAEKVLLEYIRGIRNKIECRISVVINRESSGSFIYAAVQELADQVFVLDTMMLKTNIKIIDKLILNFFLKRKLSGADIVIDFLDGDFYKLLNGVGARKITWLHSSLSGLVIRKRNMLRRLCYYDDIIMICHDMKSELSGFDVKWKERVKVIYNPFDFYMLRCKSNDYTDVSNVEKNLLNDKFILTVCRLNEDEKDVSSLLMAYYYAVSKGIEQDLIIIGDGKDRYILEEKTRKLGISDSVHFLGMKSNPYVWMKHASTFVLSSKGEGFGLVLVEALFLTKSVIASDCPVGPSEILHRGDVGALFKVGDSEQLACLLMSPPNKVDVDLEKYSVDNSVSELMKLL